MAWLEGPQAQKTCRPKAVQVTRIRFSQYFYVAPCNRNNSARSCTLTQLVPSVELLGSLSCTNDPAEISPLRGEAGLPRFSILPRGSRRQGRARGALRRAPRVGCAEP
jgi:hypothetical protein